MYKQMELLITVGAIVGIGILATMNWLNREYAGIALGALAGSGVRSLASGIQITKEDKSD